MTNEGWPVAQPRLSRRPSASTSTPWPSGKMKRSTCGLMFCRLIPAQALTPPQCACRKKQYPLLQQKDFVRPQKQSCGWMLPNALLKHFQAPCGQPLAGLCVTHGSARATAHFTNGTKVPSCGACGQTGDAHSMFWRCMRYGAAHPATP